MANNMTKMPALLAGSVIGVASLLSGCGPGYHVSPRSFDYCHPAVRWVYHTGWQTVFVGVPDSVPFAAIFSNGIRSMRRGDGCVVLNEDANGDFGGGLREPQVALDVETGRSCRCEPSGEEADWVRLAGERRTCPIGNGLELWKEPEPWSTTVALFIGTETMDPSSFVKVFEESRYGSVGDWLLFEDERLLLVSVVLSKPFGWDGDSYLLCIDLDALDLDLGDRSNTE